MSHPNRQMKAIRIVLMLVVMVPMVLIAFVYDCLCAVFCWVLYGSTWGNWRDRL